MKEKCSKCEGTKIAFMDIIKLKEETFDEHLNMFSKYLVYYERIMRKIGLSHLIKPFSIKEEPNVSDNGSNNNAENTECKIISIFSNL